MPPLPSPHRLRRRLPLLRLLHRQYFTSVDLSYSSDYRHAFLWAWRLSPLQNCLLEAPLVSPLRTAQFRLH